MARWAALIEKRKLEHPVLLVDAGDFCRGGRGRFKDREAGYFFEGVRMMSYDAAAVGEKDLDYGRNRLLSGTSKGDLKLLSSNLIDKSTGRLFAEPYVIKHVGGKRILFWRVGGVKVGIFSVILPHYVYSIDQRASDFYDVIDPRIKAMEMVSELRRRGCDIIVALSHQGWRRSQDLARDVDGIDVVINSHREHGNAYHTEIGATTVVDFGEKRSSFTEVVGKYRDGGFRFAAFDLGGAARELAGAPRLLELNERYEKENEKVERGGNGGG